MSRKLPQKSRISFRRKILFSLIPLVLFLFLMLSVEIILRIANFPDRAVGEIFDENVHLVSSADTGFALKPDIRHGLDHSFSNVDSASLTIGCFGDSTTFGSGTDRHASWPVFINTILQQLYPQLNPQVINFGVPGFTSEQGRSQYDNQRQRQNVCPDIITVGYGFNDGQWARWEDRIVLDPNPIHRHLNYLARKSHLISLIHHGFYHLRRSEQGGFRRVTPDRYMHNLEMILSRQREAGKQAILLNMEFGNSYTHAILPKIAERQREKSPDFPLPYLDFPALFAEKAYQRGEMLAREKGLSPTLRPIYGHVRGRVDLVAHRAVAVSLYVQQTEFTNEDWAVYPCRDDGKSPDERAGDNVWSVIAPMKGALPVHYFYVATFQTETGMTKEYEFPAYANKDNPLRTWYTRIAFPKPGAPALELPLVTFGSDEDMTEKIHPNARGHAFIGLTVVETIKHLVPLLVAGARV